MLQSRFGNGVTTQQELEACSKGFILKTQRRLDGGKFFEDHRLAPGRSKHYMRRVNPDAVSGSDPVFSGLRAQEILCLARELRSEGIGTTVKHTDMFTLSKKTAFGRREY